MMAAVPPLSAKERAQLPDSAFAYIDSHGKRRLPIHDASHVRNALARFGQVAFEDDEARDRARSRLLRAAQKHGIMPIGFISSQLQPQRKLPKGKVTFLLTDIERSTQLLAQLGDGYAAVLSEVRRQSARRRATRPAGSRSRRPATTSSPCSRRPPPPSTERSAFSGRCRRTAAPWRQRGASAGRPAPRPPRR